jgi:Flp pilus assembly secretin CpaC
MLPLAGSSFPDSSDTLTEALKTGLAGRGMTAREVVAIGTWPALDSLKVDLTGTKLSATQQIDTKASAQTPGPTPRRFELIASPAQWEAAPLDVRLHATDVVFDFGRTPENGAVLMVKTAAEGEVTVEVAVAEVEKLVQSLAAKAAGEHGVEIKSTKVTFTSRGPRSVSVSALVTAKAFIASATVTLSGDLDLDEHLNVRLSNLRFSGDGMVANLAGGFIRPQLVKLEGRTIPLMSFALGGITLRNVELQVGEKLRLTAAFGS